MKCVITVVFSVLGSHTRTSASVDPTHLKAPDRAVVLEDVEDAGHLRKDQDATAFLLEAAEQLVE